MTAAHVMQAVTLEDEVQALAARWSRTGLERVQIAREIGPRLLRFKLQGGQHTVKWLKGLGFSHGSAINVIGASAALNAGLTSDSVSELSDMGHLLKRGNTPEQVQALQATRAARKALVEQAGIGLGSVRYPADAAGEMAGIVTDLVQEYRRSHLTVPELPELTLNIFRLARQNMRLLADVEQGAPDDEDRPEQPTRLDPYAWLSTQTQTCDVPRCQDEGVHRHHLYLTDHPRRGHDAERLTVLLLCQRHHLSGDAAAVHGREGERAFYIREFGGRDRALEIALFRAGEYAEYLRGGL